MCVCVCVCAKTTNQIGYFLCAFWLLNEHRRHIKCITKEESTMIVMGVMVVRDD